MQGLCYVTLQHEQLINLLRANLLPAQIAPLPVSVVGMSARYQQAVTSMMQDAAPVNLTGVLHLFIPLPWPASLSSCHTTGRLRMTGAPESTESICTFLAMVVTYARTSH